MYKGQKQKLLNKLNHANNNAIVYGIYDEIQFLIKNMVDEVV